MKIVVDHIYLEREHIQRLQSIGDLEVFKDLPKTPDEPFLNKSFILEDIAA